MKIKTILLFSVLYGTALTSESAAPVHTLSEEAFKERCRREISAPVLQSARKFAREIRALRRGAKRTVQFSKRGFAQRKQVRVPVQISACVMEETAKDLEKLWHEKRLGKMDVPGSILGAFACINRLAGPLRELSPQIEEVLATEANVSEKDSKKLAQLFIEETASCLNPPQKMDDDDIKFFSGATSIFPIPEL